MLFIEASLAIYALAALAGFVIPSRVWGSRVSCGLSAVASALLIASGVRGLLGFSEGFKLFSGVAALEFKSTMLSSVFTLVFGIVFTLVSVYSIGYLESEYLENPEAPFRLHSTCYPIFLASMAAIVLVRSGLWLIVFWELMSLSSYALVVFEHWRSDVRDAGFVYFIMSHIAVALIIVVVLRLSTFSGPLDFRYSVMAYRARMLPEAEAIVLSIAFAIAMCIKGGLVPLHFWLPRAHPAAPSNISALLSGIMIKVPVYLLILFSTVIFKTTLPLAIVVCALGIISMVIGNSYAIVQRDDKVLLAYSSVGQVGYIWFAVGAGLCLYALSKTLAPLAGLLIAAGLFHFVNHALFKSSLFMVTGNVLVRARTRDMDLLGGLEKFMPYTAAACLIGCLALTGLPPFNGFASKWMIYVLGLSTPNIGWVSSIVYAGVVIAIFAGTLTGVAMIKLYTSIFTGEPRSDVEIKREAPKTLYLPELAIAFACILLGLMPGLIVSPIIKSLSSIHVLLSEAKALSTIKFYTFLSLPAGVPKTTVFFLLVGVLIPIASLIAAALAPAKPYRARVWLGGYEHSTRECRIPSSKIYSPFEELMNGFYKIRFRRPRIMYREPRGDRVVIDPWVWIGSKISSVRRIQVGSVQWYLLVMLVIAIIVLLAEGAWR